MAYYQPRNAAMRRVYDNVRSLIVGNPQIPYDSIGAIDSRMWDPEWRYRRQYNVLSWALGWFLSDTNKGRSVASGESYYWGRGREPSHNLVSFVSMRWLDGMTPSQVRARINEILSTIYRGWLPTLSTIPERPDFSISDTSIRE